MEKKTIGSLIAALRRANGMTQRELAERLNVSDKTVSRWERDEGTPELALIPVLAEIFGVTCDELLRGERRSPDSRETENGETAGTQRGEKQRRRLLKQALSDYRSRSCIVVGLSALGLLAALICNLAFLRASLGFLVGAVFLPLPPCASMFSSTGPFWRWRTASWRRKPLPIIAGRCCVRRRRRWA